MDQESLRTEFAALKESLHALDVQIADAVAEGNGKREELLRAEKVEDKKRLAEMERQRTILLERTGMRMRL